MEDSEIEVMIQVLRRLQEDQYLSLKGLAHQLGFSAGHLSMIFSGKRRPGLRFVRAVVERYPEIRQLLAKHFGQAPTDDPGRG